MEVDPLKKYILTLTAFLAVTGGVVALCLLLNGLAPSVENGGSVPADLVGRHYVVDGLVYDAPAEGYPISFTGASPGETVSVTMYFRLAELWQGETLIARLGPRTSAQRTYTIPLTADGEGRVAFLLKTDPATIRPGLSGYSIRTLFTRYAAQSPKLILGSPERTQALNAAGNSFYRILIGLYLMLMAACLALYRRKPTERYLLTVCAAAAFVLLYLLTALENGLIPVSYGFASKLSALTNVLPVSCLAYTCVGLFPEAVPRRFKALFSLPSFLAVTLACVLADLLLGLYVYQLLRRIMLFPVLVTMACALEKKLPGSRMISGAYAVMEGIALFLYVSNCVMDMEYAPLLMFLRVKEISNLVFLSVCALQIFDRFSAKFVEADRLAEQVSALNVGLERKVEERTHQLREEQARKHSMMLNVFHDLRSPIFVLRGRLAAMKAGDPEDQESLQVMDTRLDYLERLTEDLFLTAKLESGDVQYDQDIVDLSALYATVLRDMAAAAQERGIALTGLPAPAEAATWGDGFRLQQAVVNLVENAILYTPQGGSVTLSLTREGARCLLSVTDTGAGIRPEELPRVFERYYRTDSGNKRSSGLGLSIAREIVLAHRGELRVSSTVGQGSIFTVELPYCPAETCALP